jgi:hypothetical protein
MRKLILILLSTSMFAQTRTVASKADVVNAGTFSGGAYYCYLCTSINGFTQSSFNGIFLPNQIDAISGGMVVPAGANLGPNAVGVSGYVVNDADTRIGSGLSGFHNNGVDFFGIAQANANHSAAWGINTTTSDAPGTSDTYLVGYEADMWSLGSPRGLIGIEVTIDGSTGTVPPGIGAGIILSNFRTDPGIPQKLQDGVICDDNFDSTCLEVGASLPKAASVPSQNVSFCRYDRGSNRQCDAFMNEDAGGNFNLNVSAGKFVNVPQIGITGNILLGGSKAQHIQTQAANSDLVATCTVASGTVCPAAPFGFTSAFANAPVCVATPTTQAPGLWSINTTTTGWQITYANTGAATFNVICMGNPN